MCATWPCSCPPPPPSGRWTMAPNESCAHCRTWPCSCPGPIIGDPRHEPVEPCVCGGAVVALSRALPHVAAAIAKHNGTARHKAWRAERG